MSMLEQDQKERDVPYQDEHPHDPDWKSVLEEAANTDVPGILTADEYAGITENEDEVYRAMLSETRKRHNVDT